jgi:dTDP-4-amino-4,6-dideoxygalactose transaminase
VAAEKAEMKYAVGLSCCTAALHLAIKHAGETLYGKPAISHGALEGRRVFCSDMTFDATLNPVVYEGGIPVFIDTEADSWNMDPVALEKAFEMYPEVKLVVSAELYGFPGRMDLIKEICEKHGALLIEDAAEAMGATIDGKQCGSFGDYSAISYNGNKIITGSSGGCLLTNDIEIANKARKWSTQARENAPWYQHEEIGYNYRMSNVVAGIGRGQLLHLDEHRDKKEKIYRRYEEAFKGLPVSMNPYLKDSKPNFWLSCMTINDGCDVKPMQVLEKLAANGVEGRPIWKPMSMQPVFKGHDFIKVEEKAVGADIFARGLCLPSDIKMTEEEQDYVISLVKSCF